MMSKWLDINESIRRRVEEDREAAVEYARTHLVTNDEHSVIFKVVVKDYDTDIVKLQLVNHILEKYSTAKFNDKTHELTIKEPNSLKAARIGYRLNDIIQSLIPFDNRFKYISFNNT